MLGFCYSIIIYALQHSRYDSGAKNLMTLPQEDYPLLVAQDGPLKGQRWQLNKTLVLGREPSCDVVISDRQISRYHARLTT